MHGIVDEKTDIYSFGVLLLEIISGRRAVDDDQQCLVNWVGLMENLAYLASSIFAKYPFWL